MWVVITGTLDALALSRVEDIDDQVLKGDRHALGALMD